ncbi:MAG: aminotransferase class V-fold PLP-dependent enzyme [Acidobacteriota bacterium]|nr:aminotransferase class V-fold PLP-dependent enzyme [Acidobacteriota bacterium]
MELENENLTDVRNGVETAERSPQFDAAEFKRAAYAHADWIANYFENVRDNRVLPLVQPGEFAASLPESAPERGESLEAILGDFESSVFPALTLWNHPRFFAWFSVSSTPPSVLADFLAAAVNVNAMLWKSSPAATELEQVTLSWLRQWLGLDDKLFGIIYDTASIAVLQAIGAAREYVDPQCRTEGMRTGVTIYVSEQTHFSAEKAAITLGFGQKHVRQIGVDDRFRMRVDLLEKAIVDDLAAGKRPCCIVASVGSTSTSAIDPIPEIAELAERYDIWLHVDAAYGGSAAILPEMRHVFSGVERADSLVFNPHKWLYVSIDCSILYTRRPDIFRRASSVSAEVIRTPEDERVVNYNEYGVQLGRRFRALKLWYVIRYYGRQGITALLRDSIRLARLLKALVEADSDFELSAPVPFSLVCFRYRGDNDTNRLLLAEINNSGKAFLSHTILNGNYVLRFAIGNFQTNETDVRETWNLIQQTARRLTVTQTVAAE